MSSFEYRGYDAQGRPSKGLIEALDLKDAREKLSARGVMSEQLLLAGASKSTRQGIRLSKDVRSIVYRELAALLRAGLGMDQAFEVLIDSPDLIDCRVALAAVRDVVRDGGSMAYAVGKQRSDTSRFEMALLESGERSGALSEVLDRMADFLEEEQDLKDQVTTALFYPTMVFVLGIVVAFVLLGVVLPRFEELMSDVRVDIPPLSRAMMDFSAVARKWGVFVFFVLGLGVWLLRHRMKNTPAFKTWWEHRRYSLPGVGSAARILAALRFTRTLSLLLRQGVPLNEALELASRASGSDVVAHAMVDAVEEVRQGASLADSLSTVPVLREYLPAWVRAGEASGELLPLLENASKRLQREWQKRVKRLVTMLEPIVIVVVGVMVLLVALAVLLPILSLNQSIQP